MGLWKSVNLMNLQEFRSGIRSKAEFGDKLVMSVFHRISEKIIPVITLFITLF